MAPRKTTKATTTTAVAAEEAAVKPARGKAKAAAPVVETPKPAKAAPKAAAKATPKAAPKTRATKTELAPTPAPVAAKPEPKGRKKAVKAEAPVAPVVAEAAPAPVKAAAPKAKKAAEPATPGLPPLVARTVEAVETGRAVELIFQDADANPPRTFEPRQVLFDVFTRAWFMWGWDRRYNAERHHRIDQLAEVNLVEGPGRAAQGPFAEGTPANQIGGWRGGEPIPVKVTLQKQWVFAVRQAPAPFPDFKLEETEDGRALVSFTATDLRAIARWVLQFGDGMTVQEPLRLVDRVKQVAQAWGAKLTPATPAPAPAKPAPAPRPEPAEPRANHGRGESRKGRVHGRGERGERDHRDREPKEHADRESARHREPREHREREEKAPKTSSKVEVRFDRL